MRFDTWKVQTLCHKAAVSAVQQNLRRQRQIGLQQAAVLTGQYWLS